MSYRAMKYFTRPSLRAAFRERAEAGIPDRHAHPPFSSLSKTDRYVVVIAYPFLQGFGDGIPQVRVVIKWEEGGLQWQMDITLARFKSLPKMNVENPEVYRLD
jgi:hypothetical protein